MRFFTPTLYHRFNSKDDVEADRANAAWEKACRAYERHYRGFCDRIPHRSRLVLETSFHDWALLACEESAEPHAFYRRDQGWSGPPAANLGIVSIFAAGAINSLFYILWDHLRWTPAEGTAREGGTIWLYDEVDIADESEPRFVQRILFDDMSVLEIPFTSVMKHSYAIDATQPVLRTRTSA